MAVLIINKSKSVLDEGKSLYLTEEKQVLNMDASTELQKSEEMQRLEIKLEFHSHFSLFISRPHYWISQMALKLRITKFILYSIRNISTLAVKYIRKLFATPSSCGLVILELTVTLVMPKTYQYLHSTSTRQFLNYPTCMTFQLMPWKFSTEVEEGENGGNSEKISAAFRNQVLHEIKELKREGQVPSFIKNKKIQSWFQAAH